MHAEDISCPEIAVTICGRTDVRMVFNHHQMRQSELYWQYSAHGRLGYMGICDQAVDRTYVGLGAIAYGAAAAAAIDEGKALIAMSEFDRLCSYEELTAAADSMIRAMIGALPKGRGAGKNAQRRAHKRTTTHGAPSSGERCVPASDYETSGR